MDYPTTPIVPGHPALNLRLDTDAGPEDCWPVQTSRSDGYAQTGGRRSDRLAHRVAWQVAHQQQIPPGYEVHHTCATRSCVNPRHLELLTATEHRAIHHPPADLTRPPAGECRHGHDWEANGYINSQRKWVCRECRTIAHRRSYAKRCGMVAGADWESQRAIIDSLYGDDDAA